jgi:hypothetical protein
VDHYRQLMADHGIPGGLDVEQVLERHALLTRDRDAGLALMHAVGRFLERTNPARAVVAPMGEWDQLKDAYFAAMRALIRTNDA